MKKKREKWSKRLQKRTENRECIIDDVENENDRYREDNQKLSDKLSSLEERLDEEKRGLSEELSTLKEVSVTEKMEREKEKDELDAAVRVAEEKSRKWARISETLRLEISMLRDALLVEETTREVGNRESATALRSTEEKNDKLVEEIRKLKDETSTLRGDLKIQKEEARMAVVRYQELVMQDQDLSNDIASLRRALAQKKNEGQAKVRRAVGAVGRLEGRLLKVTLGSDSQKQLEEKEKDRKISSLEKQLKSSVKIELSLENRINALERELRLSHAHSFQSPRIHELEQELERAKREWKDRYNIKCETLLAEKEKAIRDGVEEAIESLKRTREKDIGDAVTAADSKARRECREEARKEKDEAVSEAVSRAESRAVANSKENIEKAVSEAVSQAKLEAKAVSENAVSTALSRADARFKIERESFAAKHKQSLSAIRRTNQQVLVVHNNKWQRKLKSDISKAKEEAQKEREAAVLEALKRANATFFKIKAEDERNAKAEKDTAKSAAEANSKAEREKYQQKIRRMQVHVNIASQELEKLKNSVSMAKGG